MEHDRFAQFEDTPPLPRKGKGGEGWRWTVGAILVLIALVPALVLLVFYYREVAVTYYMTRNPLQPSSLRMARTIEGVLVGNMRDLADTASRLNWRGTDAPTEENLKEIIGRSRQEGDLANFAGLAVLDRSGKVLARTDRRDIDPFLGQARELAEKLFETGGFTRFKPLVVPGRHPLVLLMVAVRTVRSDDGSGGVLAGLMNLTALLRPALPVPRIHGTPGRSYLLSGDGLVLASSDPELTGRNLLSLGRKAVLDRFDAGQSGSFSAPVDGTDFRYGSTLLGELTGMTEAPWLAVLEAPKAAIDHEVARTRLNMDLIVFLLVPAFMGLIIWILYKSLRSPA
jgi:hypothetical protein